MRAAILAQLVLVLMLAAGTVEDVAERLATGDTEGARRLARTAAGDEALELAALFAEHGDEVTVRALVDTALTAPLDGSRLADGCELVVDTTDDLEVTLAYQRRAVALRDSTQDAALARSLRRLGLACYQLADYDCAVASWQRAVDTVTHLTPPDFRARAWWSADLAHVHRIQGRHAVAESLLVDAVRVSSAELPRDGSHAALLNNLGALYWDQNRYEETERLFEEALAIAESDTSAGLEVLANAHLNLGVLNRHQAKLIEAEPRLRRGLELARQVLDGDAKLVIYLTENAELLARTDRWDDAIALWEEALELLARQPVPQELYETYIVDDVAGGYAAQGDPERARQLYQRSLAIRERVLGLEHPEVALSLTELARLAADPNDGLALAARAVTILESSPAELETRAEAYALRAQFRRATGASGAIDDMRTALDLVEQLRPQRGGNDESRARFVERFSGYAGTMVDWLVDRDDIEEALRYTERIRARVLRDQLMAGRVDLRRDLPSDARAALEAHEQRTRIRINQVRQQLTQVRSGWRRGDDLTPVRALERELDVALREHREATDDLRQRSPTWARLLSARADEVSVAAIRRRVLGPGESLLVYHVGNERTRLFIVDQDVTVHEVVADERTAAALGIDHGQLAAADLDVVVADAVAAIERHGERTLARGVAGVAPVDRSNDVTLATRLHALWRLLLPPSVREAPPAAITVVPDGALHALPFEALVTNADEPRYWLDEVAATRYAPSITTLLDLENAPTPAPSTMVVSLSDPSFPGGFEMGDERAASRWALPRLPGTRRETAAIAGAFGDDRVVELTGPAATETALKTFAGEARYLHLATHGLVDDNQSELLASLALAEPTGDATGEDGFLHLFEIYELDLQCDLAVLSACQTKRGTYVQGEGVFALARGFLAAGARRTVASLWAVNDAATAELMAIFFARLAEGDGAQLRFARHLNDAKRSIRQRPEWSAPYFWAPFVLGGLD